METLISTCIREVKTMLNLSSLVLLSVTLLAVYVTHWVYRWMNPKFNGVLPPGSMGLPFIGETIQLIIPSASLDLPPFIEKRLKRYGPIFRTSIARNPVIITTDPEFNQFLLRQEGKLIESWSLDTFAKVFDQANLRQQLRKYSKNVALYHFGTEALRGKLLPQMEVMARKTLSTWSGLDSIEVRSEALSMAVEFAARQIFSEDLENNAPLKISDMYKIMVQGLISFPINLPGFAHHRTLQIHKKVKEVMRGVVVKRIAESERRRGDLLDHFIQDMKTESFLNEDFIVQMMFGMLYVASDSVSTTLALMLNLLEEHPLVLEELTAEHEAIIMKREDPESALTWDEYKSMTFTLQVINEVLRLGNVAPGLFRRALIDIPYNGYTIPAGWTILIATAGLHLNENHFEDPLKFNPWRWKEVQPSMVANCYMPFGWGVKQCAGADYARVLMSTFLHVLVTKYRWSLVKGGKVIRMPTIRFPDGLHYKVSERRN